MSYSIFLNIDTGARKARRDGLVASPANPLTWRYVYGQRIYMERCRPRERATWVLNNVGPMAAPRDA